jgi:hypothetical protein
MYHKHYASHTQNSESPMGYNLLNIVGENMDRVC